MVYCLHMSDNCKCSSYIYVDVWKTVWNDSLPLSHTFRDNEFCGRWSQMKTGFHALVRKGATDARACTQERRAIPIAKPTHPRTWRLRKPGAEKRAFRVYEEVSSTQRSPPSYNMEKMQPQYSFEFFCCCICRSRALDYERLFQALGRPPSLAYLIFFKPKTCCQNASTDAGLIFERAPG